MLLCELKLNLSPNNSRDLLTEAKNIDIRAFISHQFDEDFISIMSVSKSQLTNPYYLESFIRNNDFSLRWPT